jgi:hypothetical protein
MFRLGRIYDGDTVDGLRVGRRVAAAIADKPPHPDVAWVWFSLAADAGATDGAKRAERVQSRMSASDLDRTRLLRMANPAAMPCTQNQVSASAS